MICYIATVIKNDAIDRGADSQSSGVEQVTQKHAHKYALEKKKNLNLSFTPYIEVNKKITMDLIIKQKL